VVQKYLPSFAYQGVSQFAEPFQIPDIQSKVRDTERSTEVEDSSVVGH
jgi:hypothetical protein